ncbi:MAG: hypothetical protein M3387_14265 [Actinomycetota bacterium]|nr:hypothetical protein [Actinomycetota bacterium]
MGTQSTNATREAEALPVRLVRGAVGGLLAGAAFIAINMWFVASMGDPAVAPFELISTIVLGAGAIEAGTASVPLGIAVHAVLSILFGVVFALAAPMFKSNGTVALAGGAFGALLYLVNFLLIAQTVLPQFQMPNQPLELAVHLVFGHLLAVFFYSSGVRRGERFLAF